MSSPFFWRNAGLLSLVILNLVLSVMLALKARNSFQTSILAVGIAFRALGAAYFTASTLLLLVAIPVFAKMELGDEAGEAWKRNENWAKLKVGMTPQEVVSIVGKPNQVNFGDVYVYRLHPYARESGIVLFEPRTADDSTDPNARATSIKPVGGVEWIPPESEWVVQLEITTAAQIFSAFSLALLAIISLLPLNLRAGWNSSMIYLPVVAFVPAVVYEAVAGQGGWRFDMLFLLPLYAIIGFTWLLRVWLVVRA